MQRLQELLTRYRTTLLTVILLALVGYGLYALNKPIQAREAEIRQQLEEKESQLRTLRAIYARRHELESRQEEIQAQINELRAQLAQGSRQPSFLLYLHESVTEAGAYITGLQFLPPEQVGEAGTYFRYPVQMSAVAQYPGAVELVTRLEAVGPFVSVDSLNIRPWRVTDLSLRDGWVEMQLEMSVLAEADNSTAWAQELVNWQNLGQSNPFIQPDVLIPDTPEPPAPPGN